MRLVTTIALAAIVLAASARAQACTEPVANCLECDAGNLCTVCDTGYFVSEGACEQCIADCDECVDATTCTTCSTGFFYDGATCVACEAPCTECSGSATTCTACAEGAYLSEGACFATCAELFDANCLTCEGESETNEVAACTECATGYYYDATAMTCTSCVEYDTECAECNTEMCTVCQPGNYMTLENSCTPFVVPGLECVGETYPNGEDCAEQCLAGICCSATVEHCTSCGEDGACDACEEGYAVSEGGCEVAVPTPEPAGQTPEPPSETDPTTESPDSEATPSPDEGSENGTTSEPESEEPGSDDDEGSKDGVGASAPVMVASAAVVSLLVVLL